MVLKKINISNYTIVAKTPNGEQKMPYDVMSSIENIVCASGSSTLQRLSPSELLSRYRFLTKMRESADKEGNVLLEDSDYAIVKKAFDDFKGVGLYEVELCKRIYEAEDVKVEEKGKKK
jgi:hypothetical protein